MTLSRVNSRLFIILTFLIFASLVIQIYKGTIDDFIPKHFGVAYLLTRDEPITRYAATIFEQVPGFYAFLAIILEVTNIDIYSLPVSPILFVPYLVVVLACVYSLSKRSSFALVASILLTFVVFTLPLTATHKMWIWPHGLGEILFFTFIILLSKFLRSVEVPHVVACLLILGAVPFLSYNVTYYFLFFMCGLLMFSIVRRSSLKLSTQRHLWQMLLFSIIVLFGFSQFVYNTFVPLVQKSELTLNPISMFLGRFFGGHQDGELLQLAIPYPSLLTIINIIKYVIYAAIILTGLIVARKYLRQKEATSNLLIPMYFSIIAAVIFYIIARFAIGQFALPEIFWIVIFSVIVITYSPAVIRRFNIQKCLIAMLVILLALNFTSLSIAHSSNIVQKDSYHYIIMVSDWLYENFEGRVYFPDQLTFGWSFITYYERLPQSANIVPTYLHRDNILNLYYSRDIVGKKTIIINYRENYVATGSWNNLLPFKQFKEIIEANPSIKAKIYTLNDDIIIVQT